ncbi:MAG: hypothetical protein U1G08_03305 [Verrucomicrobiota bacterium]
MGLTIESLGGEFLDRIPVGGGGAVVRELLRGNKYGDRFNVPELSNDGRDGVSPVLITSGVGRVEEMPGAENG